jgi:hypothetical protein
MDKLNRALDLITTPLPADFSCEFVQERSDILSGTSCFPIAVYRLSKLDKKHCEKQKANKSLLTTKKIVFPRNPFRKAKIACEDEHINVFICALNIKRCIRIAPSEDLSSVARRHGLQTVGWWFTYNGKPLALTTPLKEYGVCEGATICANERLLGGLKNIKEMKCLPRPRKNARASPKGLLPPKGRTFSAVLTHHRQDVRSIQLPLYTHVLECEKMLLQSAFALQADDVSTADDADLVEKLISLLTKVKATITRPEDGIFDTFENFFQIVYWLRKCSNYRDYVVCTSLAYKLMMRKSMIPELWTYFGPGTNNLQGAFDEAVMLARNFFDTGVAALTNPLVDKMRQLYTYMLVQGLLKGAGIEMTKEEFLIMDRKTKIDYTSKGNLLMLVVDVSITICERICAYRMTGDWTSLVHSEKAYTDWIKEADRLISLASFTSNLAAHNTTYFAFVSDLNAAIEKGTAVCKFTKANTGVEALSMRKKLNSLLFLKNTEITKRASQKERKAPFGVLIHGPSSVAKSTFTKMMFYYYGAVHGLGTDDHYRYVRTPTDAYWTNFDSSCWCIQMDDIACFAPQKMQAADPTVAEMLNVVNNVPYTPPQADLADKGKTPVMSKLVLCTTNAPDLNAAEYFHCPLAVRRRLPFVVSVRPKPEYLQTNGSFIDPAKLPPIDGAFPDYWLIEVQKVVPVEHAGKDDAKLVMDKFFNNVNDFLRYFAEKSKEHEGHQLMSTACDEKMKDIKVCRLCLTVGATCECVQAFEVGAYPVWYILLRLYGGYFVGICTYFIGHFVCSIIQWQIALWIVKMRLPRMVLAQIAQLLNREHEIVILSRLNQWVGGKKLTITIRQICAVGASLSVFFAMYKTVKWSLRDVTLDSAVKVARSRTRDEYENDVEAGTDDPEMHNDLELQGNRFGTVESQLEKEDSNNVWYNPSIELCRFDMPVASQSLAGIGEAGIRDLVAKNCVRLSVRALDVNRTVKVCGAFVRGNWLMFNYHAAHTGERFEIEIQDSVMSQGLTSNTVVYVNRSQLRVSKILDLVMVEIKDVQPRKDILKFWNQKSIPVSQILAVARSRDGCVTTKTLYGATFEKAFPVEALNRELPIYMAKAASSSAVGDCGTLGIAVTPRGPVILGIHTIGYLNTHGYMHVTREHIEELMADAVVIEAGNEPRFHLNAEIRPAEPHHKSLVRYLGEGTVRVYGSLPGFRTKPRSRVTKTPLVEEMCEHFDTVVKHCAPEMNGWRPWHNNLKEMVKPEHNVDADLLSHCAKTFAADIIRELTEKHGDGWQRELLFLSKKAALNGLPGVKFIDKINVKTSMGCPYNTSKKKFLVPDIDENYPDGSDFLPEIWVEYDEILGKYERGERANPIFMGHLKDEPVTFEKAKIGKTRLFTGAPAAWSVLVRSRLLSFVRLVQKNKFIFEAGPGTVTQSMEWTRIREYLTKFGEDRIVAGDYSKFDKRMIAQFILAAFDIIIEIHRAAGFDEAELRQLKCIAHDIAFPIVNVNGDILEFFGTNPSGHPLTVIINSLVNCLYVRYAFCLANPKGRDCTLFRRYVRLFTYGDDNTMGVSKQCPWFNHTTLQRELATIGVQYTMADKETESIPYIHIDDCQFLKRSWRFDDDVGAYLCPLDEESIHKSLTTWVPSSTIDCYQQMVDVIDSANSEYFFYGREVFERHHAFFKKYLELDPYQHYVGKSTLPGWEPLVERFWKASKDI